MNNTKSIEILVPVLNEEDTIELLVNALIPIVENFEYKFSLTFIDDGSTDSTYEKACAVSAISTKVIQLSRNFGQHYAITAGLDHTSGDWVVVMDCDLQDVPEEIEKLYNKQKNYKYL